MSKQLSGGSPEMTKVGIPFVNATNETIPPYACMEIVGNPKNWEGKRATTEEDENAFYMGYNRYLGVGSFFELDRASTIFCAKPSRWVDMAQDPSRVVFNSASPVEPKGIGRCFSDPYPVRALASQLRAQESYHDNITSLRVQADEWYLLASKSDNGAFKYKEFSSQYVSVKSGTETGTTLSCPVYQVSPNYQNKRQLIEAKGLWYFDGAKKTNMYLRPEWKGTNGGFLFDQNQSIVLRARGYYQFIFSGVVKQNGADDRTAFVPYSIRLDSSRTRDDGNWYTTDGAFGDNALRSSVIWQYTEKWNIPQNQYDPMTRANGSIKSKDRLRWTVNDIYYLSQVYVEKPPVQLSVVQELSPAVATHTMRGVDIDAPSWFTQPFGTVSIYYLLDPSLIVSPRDQFTWTGNDRWVDLGYQAVESAIKSYWNFKTIERWDDAFPWRVVS